MYTINKIATQFNQLVISNIVIIINKILALQNLIYNKYRYFITKQNTKLIYF